MKYLLTVILVLLANSVQAVESNSGRIIGDFFENNVSKIEQALFERELASGYESSGLTEKASSRLKMSAFILRLRASVGFEVPIFAELKIVPMIELHWKKQK